MCKMYFSAPGVAFSLRSLPVNDHSLSFHVHQSALLQPPAYLLHFFFCPMALPIISNNHIPSNKVGHAEALPCEVSSGILQHDTGKRLVRLPCFSLRLCCWKVPWKIEILCGLIFLQTPTADLADCRQCLWTKITFVFFRLKKVYLWEGQ